MDTSLVDTSNPCGTSDSAVSRPRASMPAAAPARTTDLLTATVGSVYTPGPTRMCSPEPATEIACPIVLQGAPGPEQLFASLPVASSTYTAAEADAAKMSVAATAMTTPSPDRTAARMRPPVVAPAQSNTGQRACQEAAGVTAAAPSGRAWRAASRAASAGRRSAGRDRRGRR